MQAVSPMPPLPTKEPQIPDSLGHSARGPSEGMMQARKNGPAWGLVLSKG